MKAVFQRRAGLQQRHHSAPAQQDREEDLRALRSGGSKRSPAVGAHRWVQRKRAHLIVLKCIILGIILQDAWTTTQYRGQVIHGNKSKGRTLNRFLHSYVPQR